MDPMPSREEVWKAYRVYFTHRDYEPEKGRRIGLFDLVLVKIHKPLYKLFLRAVGLRRKEKEWRKKADSMFLEGAAAGGRLLDVGCGKGDLLVRMRQLGWAAEGLEVDAEAAVFAREKHALTVHQGSLESLRFPGDSFDAITMNHVIEHVHDPVSLIRECLRVLKPGGRLVIATPNIRCLGHRRFGRNWSHLDPPRHLMLFTKKTLKECAARAGFRSIEVWCTPGYAEGGAVAVSMDREERAGRKTRLEFSKWLEASLLKVRAYFLYFARSDEEAGEELFLMGRKDA